ncbi:MAG: tyrosine phosphatase family protein [Rhizobiaceae bacterium]
MPHIIVTPLSRLSEIAESHNAERVLTLINAATHVERPRNVVPDNHLFLGFNDIVEPQEGLVPPGEGHVHEILRFASSWDQSAPMIVHCYAGVSRSTAGAYMSALHLNPGLNEMALAQELRRRSPSATPNIRLIGFADDILGRKGRMVDAIKSIGRGADCFENVPFILPLKL